MQWHLVIIAAGKSRRMKSKRPKALVQLGGQPLLAHLLDTVRTFAPQRLSVVVGADGEQIKQCFPNASDISWVLQPEPLGTGHAVLCALREHSRCRTLVLYVDGPLVSKTALRALIDRNDPLAVLAATTERPAGLGRMVMDDKGQLLKIVEEADASDAEKRIREVNTGIMAGDGTLMRELLEGMPAPTPENEQYLTDLVALVRERGSSVGCVMSQPEDAALGANTLEELAGLERIYQHRQVSALMRQGVRLAHPSSVQVRGNVQGNPESFIDTGVVLEGEVAIGEGVSIGANVTIRNSSLGKGTKIEANSVIEGATTGPSCVIGPFARIRPNTNLGESVHIGTFVEIKQATIGARSKANHQAYLGDVEIGEDCNIGAGTITCNYDGAAKHRTTIGDRVFVGSNVTLIAPVEIASDAYLAAGSTLSKNVGGAELAVARARQKNIRNWTPPAKRS